VFRAPTGTIEQRVNEQAYRRYTCAERHKGEERNKKHVNLPRPCERILGWKFIAECLLHHTGEGGAAHPPCGLIRGC